MENITQILLIEDDPKLGSTLLGKLNEQGYKADLAYDGMVAERMFQQKKYGLVILDINIPFKNGLVLCEEFRKINRSVPIIMITALNDIQDKLDAFTLGADDYLIKPFHLGELLARVRVFLRRSDFDVPARKSNVVQIGDLTIDTVQKTVVRAGNSINLTAREFALLSLLAQEPGRVFSKKEIAEKVWGIHFDTGTNTIEVYVNFLRNKIDKDYPKRYLWTKSGFGYYLKPI